MRLPLPLLFCPLVPPKKTRSIKIISNAKKKCNRDLFPAFLSYPLFVFSLYFGEERGGKRGKGGLAAEPPSPLNRKSGIGYRIGMGLIQAKRGRHEK